MIRIRKTPTGPIEEVGLPEFERRARVGEISPHHQVCFPAVTGSSYVPARDLELFRALHTSGAITFRRYFHLARMPWLTLGLMLGLIATFVWWQGALPAGTDDLLRKGAKSRTLIFEQGQWWRLFTANALHVSWWHLVVNIIFLLNLGGPTEAVFRRFDYVLILVASALGTTLLSTAVNPAVSCGASGIVFGVWGAAAVFGARHHDLLPDRYRRYFVGSVIPYSVFALYLGFAMEGVDNWGHFGGLTAGSITALLLPARLLEPQDRALPSKLVGLAALCLIVSLGSIAAPGPGALSKHRYLPRHGWVVPIPARWHQKNSSQNGTRRARAEARTYANGAGVMVALETRVDRFPATTDERARSFVEVDLAEHLQLANVHGVRISDPMSITVAGYPAAKIRAEFAGDGGAARADYVIVARGHYRYVISLSAPLWLFPAYESLFNEIVAQTEIVTPERLTEARAALDLRPDDRSAWVDLAQALSFVGDVQEATATLRRGLEKWEHEPVLLESLARISRANGGDTADICDIVDSLLEAAPWTPDLLTFSVDAKLSCDEEAAAQRLVTTALGRFPGDPGLIYRRDSLHLGNDRGIR